MQHNIHLTNLPQKLSRTDYQDVVKLAVKDLVGNKDIASIYLMGKNWQPGISDMDIIVVYKKGASHRHDNDPRNLSKQAEYIFHHGYINYDVESFKKIYYIFPSQMELIHLWGEKIEFEKLEDKLNYQEIKELKTSFTIDFFINKLLAQNIDFKNIDVRRTLLWIHSFKYDKILAEEIIGKPIQSDFPERITNLRQEWFDLEEERRNAMFIDLINQGRQLVFELVDIIDKYIKLTFDLKDFPNNLTFKSPYFYLQGKNPWNSQEFLKSKRINRFKNPISSLILRQNQYIIPSSFFYIFQIYAKGQGPYSAWFEKFLKTAKLRKIHSPGIEKRISVINQIPFGQDGLTLTNTMTMYGWHTNKLIKEIIKVKILKIVSFLK